MRHPPCDATFTCQPPSSFMHGLADIKLEQNAGTHSLGSHTWDSPINSLGAHLRYGHKRTYLWHTCTGETHTRNVTILM
jgi:hypothetical protein